MGYFKYENRTELLAKLKLLGVITCRKTYTGNLNNEHFATYYFNKNDDEVAHIILSLDVGLVICDEPINWGEAIKNDSCVSCLYEIGY